MDAFVQWFAINLLNGVSVGLLLFMLSAGLTLIFSMMGVLNFAHASFYMLGAYVGYALAAHFGFWLALLVSPLIVGALGGLFERFLLRRIETRGALAELLLTFGAAYLIAEAVKLVWGLAPINAVIPSGLDGPLFTLFGAAFPRYRAFMMGVSGVFTTSMTLRLVSHPSLDMNGIMTGRGPIEDAALGSLGVPSDEHFTRFVKMLCSARSF